MPCFLSNCSQLSAFRWNSNFSRGSSGPPADRWVTVGTEASGALLWYRWSYTGPWSHTVPGFRWMFAKWTASCSDYCSFHCRPKAARMSDTGKQRLSSYRLINNHESRRVAFQRIHVFFYCRGLWWIVSVSVSFYLVTPGCLPVNSLLRFGRTLHSWIWRGTIYPLGSEGSSVLENLGVFSPGPNLKWYLSSHLAEMATHKWPSC